jgi:hypothetical protein
MREIFNYTDEYLKKKGYKIGNAYICPKCGKNSLTVRKAINNSLWCQICQKIGDLFDAVRVIEDDKKEWSDKQIEKYIKDLLNLNITTEVEIDEVLEFYEKLGFDLVPIRNNGKVPIEKDWVNKTHRDKAEWKDWLDNGCNIGVKTGKISNITVIDFDGDIPVEIKSLVEGTLHQKTTKGAGHYFFAYEESLPKTRIIDLNIDIENNGGQVVIYPSVVDDVRRKLNINGIAIMPQKLKEYFLSRVGKAPKESKDWTEFKLDNDFKIDAIKEGNRHHVFMSLGGILRKKLNMDDTTFALRVINHRLTKPSLSNIEFGNVIKSLGKYTGYDDVEIAHKVLNYLRIVEEATARDLQQALNMHKQDIDKALSYLVREEYVIKKKRMFHILKKVEWKEAWMEESSEINYKMPYFYDVAKFRDGDMIIIGAKTKVGKSHIAMNIVKRLAKQGRKAYYVCLEAGNRFAIISQQLGLKEGDYKYCICFDPEQIELEKDAITIIDWLLPKDYANTDKIFAHLSQQLIKFGGNLIVFVQLRDSTGEFFAKDMIGLFPALVSRYLYKDENDGTKGFFSVEYIREPLSRRKSATIPCTYNWSTKELTRDDEGGQDGQETAVSV